MPETVNAIPFALLALAVAGGGVMVMASRNVVHASFWLLEVLVATAGLYLVLSAEFMALVQIMVYAGAVSVLVLFVVMLTLRRREDAVRTLDFSPVSALLALIVTAASIAAVWTLRAPLPASVPATPPGVAEFGRLLFDRWALPFEIASGVLLVALVGAVWWAGRGDEL